MCLCGVWWSKDREARANVPRVSCTWYGKQWLEVEEIWKRSLSCALFVPPPSRGLPNESSGVLVGKLLLSSCWRTVWVLCFRLYLTVGETILQRERRACLSLIWESPFPGILYQEREETQATAREGWIFVLLSYPSPSDWRHSRDIFSIIILQISQRDILNSIDREMSGDLKAGFKCIGKLIYF